jgi:hypothetical protein
MAANPGVKLTAAADQISGTAAAGLATPGPAAMAANPGPMLAAAADQPAGADAAPRNLTAACLTSGDGYLRARLAGAIDATIDWPNSGTRCQGESKREPLGVRMSFQRDPGGSPDLLFVFGLTGVRAGEAARELRVNLTVIVQGTNRVYATLGDSRCTVDSLTQRPTGAPRSFRIEARGFCTQPAHALRSSGAVLVSTFEFAGVVNYADDQDAGDSAAAPAQALR